MADSILSWLFLLAIGQALVLVAALLSTGQAEVRLPNRLLSALLLACVAIIGHAWLGIDGLYAAYPHSANAIMPLGLATGPLLYLYLQTMLFERAPGRRLWLHFLPFALATLALLPFYLQDGAAKLAWMRHPSGPPWYLALAAGVKLAPFLCYVAAGYRLMRGAAASALAAGLARLMKIWLVGGVLSVAAFGLEFAELALPLSADAIGAVALLLFVFATAFLAIRLPLGYRPLPQPQAAPAPRYAGRRLPEGERAAGLAALKQSMETGQAYRNGELTLEELAGITAMTAHELSQLINDACGANFQEYLNGYRVAALKEALRAPGRAGDSILDLGLACGFNSKSALNRVFKQHTGQTPSEYRKLAA